MAKKETPGTAAPSTLEEALSKIAELEAANAELKSAVADLEAEVAKAVEVNEQLQLQVEVAGAGQYKGFPQIDVEVTKAGEDGKSTTETKKVYVVAKNVYDKATHKRYPAEEVISKPELLSRLVAEGNAAFMSEEEYQRQNEELNKRLGVKKTLEQHLGLIK